MLQVCALEYLCTCLVQERIKICIIEAFFKKRLQYINDAIIDKHSSINQIVLYLT